MIIGALTMAGTRTKNYDKIRVKTSIKTLTKTRTKELKKVDVRAVLYYFNVFF